MAKKSEDINKHGRQVIDFHYEGVSFIQRFVAINGYYVAHVNQASLRHCVCRGHRPRLYFDDDL